MSRQIHGISGAWRVPTIPRDNNMAKDFARMEDSNPSTNPTIHEVSDPARRVFVRGGMAAAG